MYFTVWTRPVLACPVLSCHLPHSLIPLCGRRQGYLDARLRGVLQDHVRTRIPPGDVGRLGGVLNFRFLIFDFSFGEVLLLT